MERIAVFLRSHRYTLIGGILGLVGGFFYWKYVGCVTGSCPIQNNWYTMVPYGGLFGLVVGGMFRGKKK
ncbi:MAG: hypothetical protein ACEPOZ_06225 [Marinifilaceae bacterium]